MEDRAKAVERKLLRLAIGKSAVGKGAAQHTALSSHARMWVETMKRATKQIGGKGKMISVGYAVTKSNSPHANAA